MSFNSKKFIQEKVQEIKDLVGKEKAVVTTSGGVDSSVCAVLAVRALGEDLRIVFLDSGLMREGEGEKIKKIFKKFSLKIKIIRAQKAFFQILKGIEEPEEKRIAFREVFYQTLGRVIKKEKTPFLIQGTIKVDIVEAKGGIKTQHNVLEQIGINAQKYGLSVIEPLRDLYKPDVRRVAKALGLPKEIWNRMAFPGPGLALRVIGEVTPERVEIVRKATAIVEREITRERYEKMYQAFAVLLKDKATGVTKEGVVRGKKVFGHIISIRAVDSRDAVTARPTKIPWEILQKIQKKITKEIPSVIKIVYDITPKPPSTIEYI